MKIWRAKCKEEIVEEERSRDGGGWERIHPLLTFAAKRKWLFLSGLYKNEHTDKCYDFALLLYKYMSRILHLHVLVINIM